MGKKLTIILIVIITLLIATAIAALITSFSIVKKTTDAINLDLKGEFVKVVKVPEIVGPQTKSFEQVTYFWEMETTEHEVVGVRFIHDTGLIKDKDTIEATLEIPPDGDASIFKKVLPAIIQDTQSSTAADDPEKANLTANPQAGYSAIKLFVKPQTNQTNRIVWVFDKKSIKEKYRGNYQKLDNLPYYILKSLYLIQKTVIDVSG